MYQYLVMTLACSLFIGCSTTTNTTSNDTVLGNELNYLVKSDIDTVADIHLKQLETHLERLAYKLYRRNPRHCDGGTPGIEICVKQLFNDNKSTNIPISGEIGTKYINKSLEKDYGGDRVAAFIQGLRTMLRAAYGGKKEFFITDELAPQKLYNSARNIEIAVWRLSNIRDERGQLLLLSNTIDKGVANLSFERLFGKMVSLQDTLAKIVAESTKRRIKNIIQRLATAAFLPI